MAQRISAIPEEAWQVVPDYPETGICELTETTYGERRLVVRRVHLHAQEGQEELFAYWRHFAFLANFPSGSFAANAAWTVIACLAHKPLALGRAARPRE